MELALIILAFVCALLAIVGSVLPALPGAPVAYLALWLGRWSGYVELSDRYMIIMAVVTAIVFAADYFLPALITKKMGGSKAASWGALIGMIVGILFTPIGMILGMLLGAFVGQMMSDNSGAQRSAKAALGAFIGFLVGSGIKLILCGYVTWVLVAECFFATS